MALMSHFERNISNYLGSWISSPNRKPLILRGARQVGKSSVVRRLAATHFKYFLEINLEHNSSIGSLITNNSPQRAVELLEIQYKAKVTPGETLLFLDEIQATPQVLAALRYFYEQLPELHIIAAGSLLDFALDDAEFSMPVGRVQYAYMGPASFPEFLVAIGEAQLLEFLKSINLNSAEIQSHTALVPDALHQKAMRLIRTYTLVGGMPEAVATYASSRSLMQVEEVKRSLFTSFRDDFAKYRKRVDVSAVRKIFEQIPKLVGQRVKYVKLDRDMRANKIADTLDMLSQARVITKVKHSSCNGIPLAAEANDSVFKLLFLDIGLMTTACETSAIEIEKIDELNLINNGSLAEQFIGQHLLYPENPSIEPSLFFWQREERNASAEIDYVVTQNSQIVPIEVKAAQGGSLRSLHYFMAQKNLEVGVKFDSQPPRVIMSTAKLADGTSLDYKLISLPHYLVSEVGRALTSSSLSTSSTTSKPRPAAD